MPRGSPRLACRGSLRGTRLRSAAWPDERTLRKPSEVEGVRDEPTKRKGQLTVSHREAAQQQGSDRSQCRFASTKPLRSPMGCSPPPAVGSTTMRSHQRATAKLILYPALVGSVRQVCERSSIAIRVGAQVSPLHSGPLDRRSSCHGIAMDPDRVHEPVAVCIGRQQRGEHRSPGRHQRTSRPPDVEGGLAQGTVSWASAPAPLRSRVP